VRGPGRTRGDVGENRLPRVGGQIGTAVTWVDARTDGRSRGDDGTVGRRLGGRPERADQAPHGVGLGHAAKRR
jgi:hypothetical protein